MSEQRHIARGIVANATAQSRTPGNLLVAIIEACADGIAESHDADTASRVCATVARQQAEKARRAKGRNRA
jgi:hypothetical protein